MTMSRHPFPLSLSLSLSLSLWVAVVAFLSLPHHRFPLLLVHTADAAALPVVSPQHVPSDQQQQQQPAVPPQLALSAAISWPPVTSLAAANANFDQLRPGCFPIPANSASCTGFKGLLIHANFTMFLEYATFGAYPPGVNLSITSARLGQIVPGNFQLPNANQTEREVLLNTVNGDRFDQAFALAFTTNAPTLLTHVLPTCPPALINPFNPSTFPSYFNTTLCALMTSFWSPVCYSARTPIGTLGTPTSAVRTANSSTPTIVPLPTGTPRPPPVPRPMCPSSANEFAHSATRLAGLCAAAKTRGDAQLNQASVPQPSTSTSDSPANLDQFPKLAAWIAAATSRIQTLPGMPADPGCIRGVPGGHLVSVDVVSTGDPAYDNRGAQKPGWWLVSGVLLGVGVGAAGIGAAAVMGVSWKKKQARRSKSGVDETRGRRPPGGLGDRGTEAGGGGGGGEVRRRRGSASADSVVETGMPRLAQINTSKDDAAAAVAVEGDDGGGGTSGRGTSVHSASLSFRSVEGFMAGLPPLPEFGAADNVGGGNKRVTATRRTSSGSSSLVVHVNGSCPDDVRDLSPPRTPTSTTPEGITNSPLKRAGKHLSDLWRRWSMPAGMQASPAASTARVNPEQQPVARRQQQQCTPAVEAKAVTKRQVHPHSPKMATRMSPAISTSASLPRRPATSPSPLSSNAPRRGSWAPGAAGNAQEEAATSIQRPATVQAVQAEPLDVANVVPTMAHYMYPASPHVHTAPHHEYYYHLQQPQQEVQLSYQQQVQYQQYQIDYDARPMTWAAPPPPAAVVYPVYFVPTVPIASPVYEPEYLQLQQQPQAYHYHQHHQPTPYTPHPIDTPPVTRPVASPPITDVMRTSTPIPIPDATARREHTQQQTALAPPTANHTPSIHSPHRHRSQSQPHNEHVHEHERASICSAADESHIPDHYLPLINSVHVAVAHFLPRLDDELRVIRGDRIRIEWAWSDGWAYGVNEESLDEGTFPLAVFADVASPIAVRDEDTAVPVTPCNPTRPNSAVIAASAAITHLASPTAASSTTDLIAPHPRTATVIAPPATPRSTFASLDGPFLDDVDEGLDRDFDARSVASSRTASLYAPGSGSGSASLRSLLMHHPPASGFTGSMPGSPARPSSWAVNVAAGKVAVPARPRSGSHMEKLRGQLQGVSAEGEVVASRLPELEQGNAQPVDAVAEKEAAVAGAVEVEDVQGSAGASGRSSRATTVDGNDDSDEERGEPAGVETSTGRPISTASTTSTATKRASRISIYHDASCDIIDNLAACSAMHTDQGSGTNVTALVTLERDDDLMSSASDELPVVRLRDVETGAGGGQESSVGGGSSSATVVGAVVSGGATMGGAPKSWRPSVGLDRADEVVDQR